MRIHWKLGRVLEVRYNVVAFPSFFLRIWKLRVMWWPNEPFWNRLEVCRDWKRK